MMQQKTLVVESGDHEDKVDLKQIPKNRKGRRMLQRHRSGGAPNARVTSRTRTGSPVYFGAWMADLKVKSALQKTKTAKLAEHTHPGALVRSAFALLHNAGFKNVFQVTQMTIEQVLSIDGIGVKKAEALEAYLTENNVKTRWTAAG
jgi:hypothetical protein